MKNKFANENVYSQKYFDFAMVWLPDNIFFTDCKIVRQTPRIGLVKLLY